MAAYEIRYAEDVEQDLADLRAYDRKRMLDQIDVEQLELESSDKFWKLIQERRTQKSISRAELERRLDNRA